VEIEANFKAIMIENGYSKAGNLNIKDYEKVNSTHRLSSYKVKLPIWNGDDNIREPFRDWRNNSPLSWYGAYNDTKHDRHSKFENATFGCLVDAVCGLVALLTSQFLDNDFSPSDTLLSVGGPNDGMESAIGGYFRVKYPTDWSDDEKYDFKWQDIKNCDEPFDLIVFT
jgi:hypothetical protein